MFENHEKADLDEPLECAAHKHWLKYTTTFIRLSKYRLCQDYFLMCMNVCVFVYVLVVSRTKQVNIILTINQFWATTLACQLSSLIFYQVLKGDIFFFPISAFRVIHLRLG